MADDRQVTMPQLGAAGWLRWMWRQLTSMRIALFLLLLLAVGAVPGSIWPQRSIDAARTADWIAEHETLGPLLDRLGFFEVYASPWFSAIYLLLLVSLVGCILPRSRQHWRASRATPPRTPRRLDRLPAHTSAEVDGEPAAVQAALRDLLRSRRFRVHAHDADSVSAERGYLKETGNLVFHVGLVLVIIGVAIGHLFGWKGDVIVPVGSTFANTLVRYDTFSPGPWVDPEELTPFTVKLNRLDATFEEEIQGRGQFGSPRDFVAYTTTTDEPGAAPQQRTLRVNHPLELPGASAFLLGNGYAPVITVRDKDGEVLYRAATPFLAQDNNYSSVGAVKVPGAQPTQLGFFGRFLPTAIIDPELGPTSIFPDAKKPALALGLYEGQLFPDSRPQSVYTLDTEKMTQVTDAEGTDALRLWLEPGQTVQLPGDRGSITFEKVERFAGLSIRHDPGKELTLLAALAALAGLVASLVVRRRRVFGRVAAAAEPGRTVVTLAAMAKDDDDGLPELVTDLLEALRTSLPSDVPRTPLAQEAPR